MGLDRERVAVSFEQLDLDTQVLDDRGLANPLSTTSCPAAARAVAMLRPMPLVEPVSRSRTRHPRTR